MQTNRSGKALLDFGEGTEDLNLNAKNNHYKFKVYLSFSLRRIPQMARFIKDYLLPAFRTYNIDYHDFLEHEQFHHQDIPDIRAEIDKNLADSDIFLLFIDHGLELNIPFLIGEEEEKERFNPFTGDFSSDFDYVMYEICTSFDKFGFNNPYNRFQVTPLDIMAVAPMEHVHTIYFDANSELDSNFALKIIDVISQGYQKQQYQKRSNLFWRMRNCVSETVSSRRAKAHLEYARLLYDKAKLYESIAEYEKAFELDKNLTDALVECADAYILNEDYQKAQDCLLTALKVNPNIAKAHNNLGFFYKYDGDNEKGDAEIKKAVELDSKYIPYLENAKQLPKTTFLGDINDNYGVKLQKQKQYQQAIYYHTKAIELWTTNLAATFNNLGWGYYNIGDFKEAIYYYNKSLAIKPDYARALKNRKLAVDKLDNAESA